MLIPKYNLQLASERSEKSFEEAKDDKEKELNLMVDWAVKGFLPSGPRGFAPSGKCARHQLTRLGTFLLHTILS